MATFVFAFVVVLASIVGLGVGVLFGRAPLRRSCGEIACIHEHCIACQTHRDAE